MGAAIVITDWPFQINLVDLPEFSFYYFRRHGSKILYGSSYTNQELLADKMFIEELEKDKKDVFVFFNNDAHGYAVKNAIELKKMLKKSNHNGWINNL